MRKAELEEMVALLDRIATRTAAAKARAAAERDTD
jgi:hypothetical protein